MTNKLTHEEYYKSLPKKQVGTAVLFFNSKGELLIVKPNYRDAWLVPGGSTDAGESPRDCATRETKEEIGLTISEPNLTCVYFSSDSPSYSDHLKFLFHGGILNDTQISEIKLQEAELGEYRFCTIADALPLVSPSLQKSIPACIEAIKNKTVAYIER
jgi:8-oxo-dGTP diphosphatase